jgi:RNA-binding protein 5/10
VRPAEPKPDIHQQKEQLAEIEKWSQKGKPGLVSSKKALQSFLDETAEKMEDQKRAILGASLGAARSSAVSADQRLQQEQESTVTTSGGKPICRICMRKFPTVDKLRQHEQQSELHKANLAKAEAAKAAEKKKVDEEQTKVQEKKKVPTIKYKDRASQRRMLYCDLPSGLPQRNRDRLTDELESRRYRPALINPELHLGEHNIGNQLFQKMSKANTRPGTARQARPESSDSTSVSLADHLRKDWALIESLANRTAQERSSARMIPGSGLGSNTSAWENG